MASQASESFHRTPPQGGLESFLNKLRQNRICCGVATCLTDISYSPNCDGGVEVGMGVAGGLLRSIPISSTPNKVETRAESVHRYVR